MDNNMKYFGSCKLKENSSPEPKRLNICGIDRDIYGFEVGGGTKEYTVLLVGATKCGKSTIIDFLANFFMGVCEPKNGVINVTIHNPVKENFYIYSFCAADNTVFNFIDSPSINNDSGFIDKKRKQNYMKHIKEMKQNGIRINALGFVIQNHFVRLAPAEESMLKFVTGLLKEEDIGHIIPFITYSDANTPPVLDALRTFGIAADNCLLFNNVCLNSSIKKITDLSEMYWENGLEDIQKGLDIVMNLQPVELPDIPQEDIQATKYVEPILENTKENIGGRRQSVPLDRGRARSFSNSFEGRRNVSSNNKESKSVFRSLRISKRSKKKAKEVTAESQTSGSQQHPPKHPPSQRVVPSQSSKKRTSSHANNCNII